MILSRLCAATPQILGHEVAGTVVAVGRRRGEVEAWRSRDEFSSHSLRQMFLLRTPPLLSMQAVQDHGIRPADSRRMAAASPEYVKAMPWVPNAGLSPCPTMSALRKQRLSSRSHDFESRAEVPESRRAKTVLIAARAAVIGPSGLQLLMVANLEGATALYQRPHGPYQGRAKSLNLGAIGVV